jgi:hypothetical protein
MLSSFDMSVLPVRVVQLLVVVPEARSGAFWMNARSSL